ncbi:restriction endonuclease subunit S [Tautonia marina]|uniref:restriction endonuclease subunit S n=1 Tax=Tautonia marina TaxID=2653855 RepID=UPI001260DBC2|nr:restriction endonuclease subunit S [Tautonia marina]
MMPDLWTESTFGDLIGEGVLQISDGYRAKNSELGGDGPIFLRAGHVTDSHIHFDGVDRFRAELTDRVLPKMSKPGDVVVTTKGNSTGRVTYVDDRMPRFVYSPHLSFWRSLDLDRLWPGFLRYWSRGREFEGQLSSMKTSTDMAPYLSLVDQKRLHITLPPIDQQREIAAILGALDDKIDLNRRMNGTLEGMARAVFRSWFVDFDPVRAKSEGRQPPGLDAETAALFPSSFADSPLGPIPEGWHTRRWGDLVRLEYGKSLRSYEDSDGPFTVFGTNGPIGRHVEPLCSHPGIIIGRKGAYRGVHYHDAPFFVIDTAYYVEPKSQIELRWAYYEMLRLDINGMDSGSAIPSTSRDDFYSLPVIEPPVELQRRFVEVLTPCWANQKTHDEEAATLAALRDTLLPKLLSGEVRIEEMSTVVQ